MRIITIWKQAKERYTRFVEKQGFAVITVVCVAVITATALWTGNRPDNAYTAPTPPVTEDVSAAQLVQQRLRDAVTATPAPTETPVVFRSPLAQTEVLRGFDPEVMHYSDSTGIWAIHDGVDLSSPRGSKVVAMADGTVTAAGKDLLNGVWLEIDHDGVVARYVGMALDAAYLPGDMVYAGDTIGFVGSGPADEADLEPHLHLQVTRDGTAIDPCNLWQTTQPET